jgi:hypothetical protein
MSHATDRRSFLTPVERRSEVASILAAGVLRLRARAALPDADPAPEKSQESGLTCLEIPDETVLSVHNG